MSLDNNSANNFKDFLDAIKPYLNYQFYDMSGMGVEAFQFSTDEKPVGMWTDRKILYAKTIVKTGCSDGQTSFAHNISNIDEICHVIAGVGNDELSTGGATSGTNRILFYVTNTNVNILLAGGHSNETANITIFYTKTTDSPLASGEKFAGLTASGEVIYEKTLTVNNVTVSEKTWTNIVSAPSNSNLLIDSIIYTNANLIAYPFVRFNNGYLQAFNATQIANINKATIRYTKSS